MNAQLRKMAGNAGITLYFDGSALRPLESDQLEAFARAIQEACANAHIPPREIHAMDQTAIDDHLQAHRKAIRALFSGD